MNTGNTAKISSLLSQSFGNGGLSSGFSGSGSFQCGGTNISAESNDPGYNPFSSSFATSNMVNPVTSNFLQNQQMSNPSGNQLLMGQQKLPNQQLELQKFQQGQQYTLLHGQQQQHQSQQQRPQQYQSVLGGLKGFGPVSFEPQIINDQHGPQQQLQSSRNLNPGDPQKKQIGRGQGPVNIEPQVSNQPMFLHQQQQQQKQQFLQMSKPSSHPRVAQMNLLQQQQILQLQQQQHEQQQQQQRQRMKATSQTKYQSQQEVYPPNLSVRSPVRPVYEPGMGAHQLTRYIYQQRQRPNDNNIEFWRKFVADFFAPNAKKRWCVSLYGNSHQTSGVFPQDTWHCEICNVKPSRGFETTVEVLPRLYKIKYDSGTLEELLYVDMPREYQNSSGQIVLDYAKAMQECVFEQLRVARDGRLRFVFSPDLKICSWEFCARHHEEIIPRRLIIPQVGQLGAASQKYQAAVQNASSSLSRPELQSNCNTFVVSARQLSKALEVPLVNDLGYTKRYVRCLQISEVVNSMKDLIDYSQETSTGAMESLAKFPCKTSSLSRLHVSGQQSEGQLQLISGQDMSNDHNTVPATSQQQLTLGENSKDDHNSAPASSVQLSTCNVIASENESHGATSTATLATNILGLLPQNSMSSRHENQMNNPGSPHAGTPVQIPSAGSSTSLTTARLNPSSPFSALTPSSSNNPPQASQNALPGAAPTATTATHIGPENSLARLQLQQSSQSNNCPNESQSSVEKIIQEIMTSPRFSRMGAMVGVGSVGNNRELINGTTQVRSYSLGGGNANNAATNGVLNNNSATGVARYGNFNPGWACQ